MHVALSFPLLFSPSIFLFCEGNKQELKITPRKTVRWAFSESGKTDSHVFSRSGMSSKNPFAANNLHVLHVYTIYDAALYFGTDHFSTAIMIG